MKLARLFSRGGTICALLALALSCCSAKAGTITGTLQTPSGLPIKNGTITFTLSQAGLVVGTGAIVPTTASCWTSVDGTVVGLPNPLALPSAAVNSGSGTLPAGTYFVELAFYDALAHVTLVSPEFQIGAPLGGSIIVQPPVTFPASASGMQVFIGTTSGGETLQGSTVGNLASFTQSTPLATGAAVPATNNTVCSITFNDTIIPMAGYSVALLSSSGKQFPGYPQLWQLNGGPTGTINVSQGAPLWDGRVIYPQPILSQPLNHGQQSIAGPLNMGGYNLTNIGNLGVGTPTPLFPIDNQGGLTNSKSGYLVNGAVPAAGLCLSSDGTAYDTPSACSNGTVQVAAFPGGDLGAQINNAVAFCVGANKVCTLVVSAPGGTISTCPSLPVGFSLVFYPQGVYNLSCHWLMNHRAVTYQFNGAQFFYTLNDGGTAFYVGKNLSGTVNVVGTAVTWVGGNQFTTVDVGDQIQVFSGGTLYTGNVAAVNSPTSITLLGAIGNFAGVPYSSYMNSSNSIGGFPGRNVSISDMVVNDLLSSTAADVGLEIELADSVTVSNYTANTFFGGTCMEIFGGITANIYGLHCNANKNGLVLDQNHIAGFLTSTSNANRFFGIDLQNSPVSTGNALLLANANQNEFYGLHVEGNFSHILVNVVIGGMNDFQLADFESNGDNTVGATDFTLGTMAVANTIHGGSLTSGYTGSGTGHGTQTGFSINATAPNNTLRDILFAQAYPTCWTFNGGTSGYVYNLVPALGCTNTNPAFTVDNAGNLISASVNAAGSIVANSFVNAVTGYKFNGTAGFTGTKTAGSCVLTIQGGIITNVTGC